MHFLLLAVPLVAQNPADRTAIERFRDTLEAVDSAQAATIERQLQRRLSAREDDPLVRIKLGFTSLRYAELGRVFRHHDAVATFERATRSVPDWPYAWYGLALALVGRAEWRRATPANLGPRVGAGDIERAAAALAGALEADPEFVPALLGLEVIARHRRDSETWGLTLRAMRRTASTKAGKLAVVLLARGRVERQAGDVDSAIAAFRRYQTNGESRGLGLLELARTQLPLREAEGVATYFEGAAYDDSATVAGYRVDLEPIVDDSVLAELDGLRGARRVDWLRRFWGDRDRIELREAGERLEEHYRRLQYARRHFSLSSTRRYYRSSNGYRSGSAEFDDRGIIYLRHGEPSDRLRPFIFRMMPNESWRYLRPDGDLVFHFSSGGDAAAGGDLYDYRLIESVFDLGGADRERDASAILYSRTPLSPIYSKMMVWGTFGVAKLARAERAWGEKSILVGTTTDSYQLRFARPLDAVAVTLAAVGADPGGSRLHLAYAVPLSKLGAELLEGSRLYPIRLRLVIFDSGGHAITGVDSTVIAVAPSETRAANYLTGRVVLPVPPGSWNYRLALRHAESGTLLPSDTLHVGRYDGSVLAVSDLVLGSRTVGPVWETETGDSVFFNPRGSYRPGEDAQLYYEVYGVEPGAEYRVEVAITRKKKKAITLRFLEKSLDRTMRVQRSLDLRALRPGEYQLDVIVTDAKGGSDRSSRSFTIVNHQRAN